MRRTVGIEAGDDALERVTSVWPYLSRDLRLAIVAITKLVDQQSMDVGGSDQLPVAEGVLIPF